MPRQTAAVLLLREVGISFAPIQSVSGDVDVQGWYEGMQMGSKGMWPGARRWESRQIGMCEGRCEMHLRLCPVPTCNRRQYWPKKHRRSQNRSIAWE